MLVKFCKPWNGRRAGAVLPLEVHEALRLIRDGIAVEARAIGKPAVNKMVEQPPANVYAP